MNAFKQSCKVETQGKKLVMNYLENYSPIWQDSKEAQAKADIYLPDANVYIELKVEKTNKYKNLFIETWSNKKWGTKGWFYKLKCDYLFYLFLDTRELFIIKPSQLKEFMEEFGELYPEKAQSKYKQLNDTWGRCIRINRLLKETDMKKIILKNGIKKEK